VGILDAQQLELGYDGTTVIRSLDCSLEKGRITAFIGRNGCGKSTLLRALARLMKPSAGTVLLDGKSISTLPTKEVAKRVAVLPQSAIAPEQWTVTDLVAQGRYPHQAFFNQWSPEDEAAIEKALALTQLSPLADRRVDSLSGGQRQRAWIAMALAQETEILLLDEPTTFLDMAHQIEVLEVLADLNRSEGRTIAMVVHDLNQAARYAHHVVAISDGGIHSEGAPAAVLTEEMVRDVFGITCRIIDEPEVGRVCMPIRVAEPAAQEPGEPADAKVHAAPASGA